MRKLASIQKVLEIVDVEGTDNLQVALVLGWRVIINRNDGIKVGDNVVYFEIDSLVPEKPEFEFLRKRDFKIKTMKMRGITSQGLVSPMSILPEGEYSEGDDVTDIIGVKQFNSPKAIVVVNGRVVTKRTYRWRWLPYKAMHWLWENCYWMYKLLTVNAGDSFPAFVPKTDETRVQLLQALLDKYLGQRFVVTEKIDGQSFTAYLNKGEYGVCSRGIDLDVNNSKMEHVAMATKLGIEDKLRELGGNWAVQGEMAGPGIQSNRQGLAERDVYFFGVFNIDTQRYLDHEDFVAFIENLGLKTVPVLDTNFVMINDIDALIDMASDVSFFDELFLREGIVFRPWKDELCFGIEGLVRGRVSFKAISPKYLLKHKE